MPLVPTPSRRRALCALAALALASSAHASIVYVDLQPNIRPIFFPGPTLDLDNDGTFDPGFDRLEGHAATHWCWHTVYGNSLTSTQVTSTRHAANAVIGANVEGVSFVNSFELSGSEHMHTTPDGGPLVWANWNPGSPTDTTPVFMGFRFTSAGQQHFGWFRYQLVDIQQDLIHHVEILDYAYETNAAAPIAVGAIPAPSALALLSLAPLALRRRR
jgi:hypothetical protein